MLLGDFLSDVVNTVAEIIKMRDVGINQLALEARQEVCTVQLNRSEPIQGFPRVSRGLLQIVFFGRRHGVVRRSFESGMCQKIHTFTPVYNGRFQDYCTCDFKTTAYLNLLPDTTGNAPESSYPYGTAAAILSTLRGPTRGLAPLTCYTGRLSDVVELGNPYSTAHSAAVFEGAGGRRYRCLRFGPETSDLLGVEKKTPHLSFEAMKTLTIQLSDETADRLEALAEQLGVSLEEVAQLSLDDQIKRLDREYEEAAEEVLSKNAELYRRLS